MTTYLCNFGCLKSHLKIMFGVNTVETMSCLMILHALCYYKCWFMSVCTNIASIRPYSSHCYDVGFYTWLLNGTVVAVCSGTTSQCVTTMVCCSTSRMMRWMNNNWPAKASSQVCLSRQGLCVGSVCLLTDALCNLIPLFFSIFFFLPAPLALW